MNATEEDVRLLDRPFPPYAYLPGKSPHPIRDPQGHSYGADHKSFDPDAWAWGMDLFNHGFYWEAHEAWEQEWRGTPSCDPWRGALKALILCAATGVKLREGKMGAAGRHGQRCAALLRSYPSAIRDFEEKTGLSTSAVAEHVEAALQRLQPGQCGKIVFNMILGRSAT